MNRTPDVVIVDHDIEALKKLVEPLRNEFEFYLTDLRAKLLIVAEGSDSPAVAVAEKLGMAVARLKPTPEQGAGSFTLSFAGEAGAPTAQGGFAEEGDVALVLHTSGTTSRPKIVPLSQGNVCASARHIRTSLAFTAEDRGLNIMPLFHIHGLIAGTLAPLSAGGQICCTPGFNALKFFAWMEEAKPTWYTGVPTMHQAILGRAARNREIIAATPLRFIRSSSASLPPQVLRELEETFGAPVIEAYGMTEAAHQMACNPLPPRKNRPGSVGIAAGPEIAVVGPDGEPLAQETYEARSGRWSLRMRTPGVGWREVLSANATLDRPYLIGQGRTPGSVIYASPDTDKRWFWRKATADEAAVRLRTALDSLVS